jgi:hypothetical protein
MKLLEEFKLYETLWEDAATELNKNEYLISYEDKVFNLATEEGLQSYIALRAPKLGKKKVRVELKQIIGHDKEPTSREYIEAKNELIDISGKLEAVEALFKVPLRDVQSAGVFWKIRRRLFELRASFKPQYEAARLKLLNIVESANGKTKNSKTSHSAESSCMWTTPDGRQIDLNNPTAVAEEIDHLIQVTEQDYISYNNKRVASGKPSKDFSKLLKSQRDVLVHEFNYLRDAIIAPSTVVDKKAAAEEELNRYYYAYDTGALVPKTVHEEFKLYENMWEFTEETARLQEASDPYTTKDFVWLSDSYYADKFKRAVLAYLNGASLEDALTDIKGELMAAGSAPGSRKTSLAASVTTGEGEYCIAYRVASWPANETAETFVNADSKEDAEELFFDYMLDPDNYDAGETVLDESDITIIDIYKKP